MKTVANAIFFLGGDDLEMLTIRDLLARHVAAHQVCDKGLAWGARASDYAEEIRRTLAEGDTPVLIELTIDIELDERRIVIVDHHGARAGKDAPTSLEQIFALLKLPGAEWTRWMELVAANDKGHIAEMLEQGASEDEIKRVRAADRAAQGITVAEERAAEEAVRQAETHAGGYLTVVRLAHARTAAVADRMEKSLGGDGYRNLLVVSPGQLNFFGDGAHVKALDDRFPGGWYGGALPTRGYWGSERAAASEVLGFLLQCFANEQT